MKRSHVLVAVTAFALAGVFGGAAGAATPAASGGGGGVQAGTIGSAPPSPGAATRIRALGLEDGDGSESDGGGDGSAGAGKVAHGKIGSARPNANAARRIRSLGRND